jgi:dihydrofolate reductase
VIGVTDADGRQRLPWRIKSDLRHFKSVTIGGVVIMGRRTFRTLADEGAPGGLPNRLNIVVSRSAQQKDLPAGGGVLLARSIEDGVGIARARADQPVFIIGGGEIYRETLARGLVTRMDVTDVDAEITAPAGGAVTVFPGEPWWSHDPSRRALLGWRLTGERFAAAEKDGGAPGDEFGCWFRTYERA